MNWARVLSFHMHELYPYPTTTAIVSSGEFVGFILISGVHLAMSGPQTVGRGRHDPVEPGLRVSHRGEPEKEVHGRLDLHLHRPSPRLSQPLQAHEVLHPEGDRDVPGRCKLIAK